MTTRRRIPIIIGLVLSGALALYGVALADHGGLQGLFNARGTLTHHHGKIDVAVVGAQLHAHGQTGWHTHPRESIVTVQAGAPALIMQTARRRRCVERRFEAGQAFLHPAGPHNFVNSSEDEPLNFGVAYFVPVGAALLAPAAAPEACS
jgi:hypothetical protein